MRIEKMKIGGDCSFVAITDSAGRLFADDQWSPLRWLVGVCSFVAVGTVRSVCFRDVEGAIPYDDWYCLSVAVGTVRSVCFRDVEGAIPYDDWRAFVHTQP